MRRCINVSVITLLLIVCVRVTAYAAPVATIIGLSGKVETAPPGSDIWTTAQFKQPLEPNTRVRTATKSGVVILLETGSRIKIGPLTLITIAASSNSRTSGGVAFNLANGKVWAKVNKLSGAKDAEFVVRTPTALCGVRGTEFAMDVGDDGTSVLTVVEGNASFSNEFGAVNVGSSQQSTAAPGKAPTPPVVVDTKNWIEWSFDIRAMGTDFETPFNPGDSQKLNSIRDRIEQESPGDDPCEKQTRLGEVLYDLGRYDEAAGDFTACLDDTSFGRDAAYALGMTKLEGGDTAEATRLFNGIIDSLKEKKKTFAKISRRFEIERQEPSTASINGKKLTRGGPALFRPVEETTEEESSGIDEETASAYSAKAYFGLGMVSLKERNFDDARTNFDKSLKSGESCLSDVGMATALMNMGDYDAASEFTRAAAEKDHDCYQALTLGALLELAVNRPDPALQSAAAAVDAAPWSPDAHAALARIRFFRGESDAARTAANDTLALSPTNPAAHEILARIALSTGDYRAAIREALLCLAIDENNPWANDDLAMIYYTYRAYDGAILHWKKAIAARPGFVAAEVHLARLYNDLEEKATAAEAEKLARQALDVEKENDSAYDELGRALDMQGRYTDAEAAFLSALRIAPNNASHLARIATFYVYRHKTDLAVFYAQKAVAAQPANPNNHFVLGRAYEAVDETASAKAAYIDALYLDPDFSLARYQLGIILGSEENSWDALSEMHTAALEMPRVVTLAEYRGPSRVYATAGSHNSHYFEGVNTGDADDYKLNYRAVYTDASTNGFREVNGGEDSNGGSLLGGYQANRDSSFVLYGDTSSDDKGLPGPATGSFRVNDPDDNDNFKSNKYEMSWRGRLNPNLALTLRVGHAGTREDKIITDDIDLINTDDRTVDRDTEYELAGDYRPGDRTTLAFGAFSSRSRFDSNYLYEDLFFGDEILSTYTTSFRQKNYYLRAWHMASPKLRLNAGIEKSKHNIAGNHSTSVYGFDYNVNSRSWLRFLSREYFRLSFHPRYEPVDAWTTHGDMDDSIFALNAGSSFGIQTRWNELSYETRLRDGTFIKLSGHAAGARTYDPDTDYREIYAQTKTSGVSVNLDKPISRRASVFVAVVREKTTDKTADSSSNGLRVPYSDTSRASLGLYLFPTSYFTVKIVGEHFGKRYTNARNTRELPAFHIVTVQFRYDPSVRESYMLTVRNLFDKEYELTRNYPEDGRSYELGMIRWF